MYLVINTIAAVKWSNDEENNSNNIYGIGYNCDNNV